jgi:hypothetical protein
MWLNIIDGMTLDRMKLDRIRNTVSTVSLLVSLALLSLAQWENHKLLHSMDAMRRTMTLQDTTTNAQDRADAGSVLI